MCSSPTISVFQTLPGPLSVTNAVYTLPSTQHQEHHPEEVWRQI